MSIVTETLEKIRNRDFIFGILGLILLITPGFLTIYHFQRELFLSLDFFKLIILAISLIASFVFINTILFLWVFEKEQSLKDDDLFASFLLAVFFSGLQFYLFLLISFLLNRDYREFLIATVSSQVILYPIFIIKGWLSGRATKKQVAKTNEQTAIKSK